MQRNKTVAPNATLIHRCSRVRRNGAPEHPLVESVHAAARLSRVHSDTVGPLAHSATAIVAPTEHQPGLIIVRDWRHSPSLGKCSICQGHQQRRFELSGPMDIPVLMLASLAVLGYPIPILYEPKRGNPPAWWKSAKLQAWLETPSLDSMEGWFESIVKVRCKKCSPRDAKGRPIWKVADGRHVLRKLCPARVEEFTWQARIRPWRFKLYSKSQSQVWMSWLSYLGSLPMASTVSTS